MFLFNTLHRKKEEFIPLVFKKVLFYHCGPTVYWIQHIGNLRGMTMGDLLVRTLKYLEYSVTHVRNYTDVGHLTGDNIGDADSGEDRMEKGARREGLTPDEIAEKYISIFEHDTKEINLLEPQFKPRPSKLIPEIIEMVSTLIDKEFAYVTDMGVYFNVTKFPKYTELSRQNLNLNLQGSGKGDAVDNQKKNPADFALWVFKTGIHKNALQTWVSPFFSKLVQNGEGFPGWHIECSVMSKKYLGDKIDIHYGGVEHISIHHTNEIAQSESANGVKFVNYWLHNEHLLVNNEKMAKSKGTGFSLQEIIDKGFKPLVLRYFFLQAHYRSQQNFTWEALKASEQALENLLQIIFSLKFRPISLNVEDKLDQEKLVKFKKKFVNCVSDDVNIPAALAIFWEVLNSKNLTQLEKKELVLNFDQILGLHLYKVFEIEPNNELTELLKNREGYRREKNFIEADKVRAKIESQDWLVKDTANGQYLIPKSVLAIL